MSDTRQRLTAGALETIRTHGFAGASARAIAAAAGANQALIFYHFGTVDELISVACRQATEERVRHYRARLDEVGTLRDLLDLGRALHAEERGRGNVAVLAQLLSGAQRNPTLAAASAAALDLWVVEIERTLVRLLDGSPLADALDIPGLSRAVSAGFIGLELYETVDAAGADRALAALDQLAVLVEVVTELGPVARRTLRSRLRRATR